MLYFVTHTSQVMPAVLVPGRADVSNPIIQLIREDNGNLRFASFVVGATIVIFPYPVQNQSKVRGSRSHRCRLCVS